LKYFFILLLTALHLVSNAQRPPVDFSGRGNSTGNTSNPSNSSIDNDHIEPDTGRIIYCHSLNPTQEFVILDTILTNFQQKWNPAQRGNFPTATLGNLGSAHTPMIFEANQTVGFDVGWHQFDRYLAEAKDIKYYNIKTPYSYVDRTQRSKDDVFTTVDLGLNYDKKPSFSFQYRKINQQDQYQYAYPGLVTRNTALSAGLRYQRKRYDGFFSYTKSDIGQQNNGGLTDILAWKGGSNTVTKLGEIGKGSFSDMKRSTVTARQYYSFSANSDSLKQGRKFLAMHEISWESARYKSYDNYKTPYKLTKADSLIAKKRKAFYGDTLLTDQRGLRFFVGTQHLQNSFTLSTTRSGVAKNNQAVQQRDLIEVGITHSIWWIQQGINSEVRNNLFLTGKANFTPSEKLKIETEAQYGLAFSNLADYRLQGRLQFSLGKLGVLKGYAISQAYSPNLVQSQVDISGKTAWETDFKKTFSNSFGAEWALPKFGFSAAFHNHLLNNFIAFDSLTSKPFQSNKALNISQLIIHQHLRFKAFHSDNSIIIQNNSNKGLIGLPRILNRHTLYAETRVFKSGIPIRLGAELYYTDTYQPMAYQPLIGQFYVQNRKINVSKPMLDAYFSARIMIEGSVFRTFVKMENITNALYTPVANYPQYGRNLRIGFTWQFVN
jgi:hypothetical protein